MRSTSYAAKIRENANYTMKVTTKRSSKLGLRRWTKPEERTKAGAADAEGVIAEADAGGDIVDRVGVVDIMPL